MQFSLAEFKCIYSRAGHSLFFSRFALLSPLNFYPWIAIAHFGNFQVCSSINRSQKDQWFALGKEGGEQYKYTQLMKQRRQNRKDDNQPLLFNHFWGSIFEIALWITALFFPYIAHEWTTKNLILSVCLSLFALFLKSLIHSQNRSSLKSKDRLSYFKERCVQLWFFVFNRKPAIFLCLANSQIMDLSISNHDEKIAIYQIYFWKKYRVPCFVDDEPIIFHLIDLSWSEV